MDSVMEFFGNVLKLIQRYINMPGYYEY